jgi:hypothetical protein
VISGSITQMLYPSVSLPIAQGTTPPPPPPPHHAIAFGSSAKSAQLSRSGALSFTVTPDGAGSANVSGTIALRKGKSVRFATRTLSLTAGAPVRVTLKLSKKNAAAVRKALRHRKLTARVTLAAVSATGDASTTKLTLKLKR